MFDYKQLKNIHLEITNRCQASCPMCARNYHGGLENPMLRTGDWTLSDFKIIMSKNVLSQIEGFYFCGNFGDPIINDNLLDMVKYSTFVNKNLYIRIHTNGSARSTKWWTELAQALPKTHNVIFALDGLEDTHSLYRIGTNYNKILENAKAFINAGGTAEWAFIKFKHNEHQLEDAKKIASKLGFARFTYKDSSRFVATDKFKVLNKNGKVTHYLEPPSGSNIVHLDEDTIKNFKEIVKNTEIDCYVRNTKEIYIDAFRRVFPCCFLASTPYNYSPQGDRLYEARSVALSQYRSLLYKLGGIDKLDAIENNIEDIISSEAWQKIWNEVWNIDKFIVCARTCGTNKFSKPKDQFIEVKQLDE